MTIQVVKAEELNGAQMDKTVEFDWWFPVSLVKARVSGALREVHHSCSDSVTLWLSNSETGDKAEFTIPVQRKVDVYT
ncbi:hypothetical protein AIRMID_67 [Mycobacterium phage Airmid]|nr:hypothetical protein AIRMID_67 [Mycobacterium phage Airmid]